jgi:peroxiredoxin
MRRILASLISLAFVYACSSSRRISPLPAVGDDRTDYIIETIAFVDNYLNNTVPQTPDSIIRAVDSILSDAQSDTVKMNFLARHICDKYLGLVNSNTKISGIENVAVHIIDNYYLPGKASTDDQKFINEIADYANKNRSTLIGKQAKNLKMETINGGAESLYDIDSPYILLCFYDASCEHCRYEIPKIHEIFHEFKDSGLAGFCVYTRNIKKEWLEFVSTYKLTEWINAWDPANTNDFRIAYSLYYVPQVYVLDKDKKIAGRGLDSKSLSELLKHLIRNKDNQ